MVKVVKFGIEVANDSKHSFDDVIRVFQDLFGWDITQSANSAYIIHTKGSYVVKWFDSENTALYVLSTLKSQKFNAKLVIDRSGSLE